MITYPETLIKPKYVPFEYPDMRKEPIPDTSIFFPVPESRKSLVMGYNPITCFIEGQWFARFVLLDHTEYLVGPFPHSVTARRAVLRAQHGKDSIKLTYQEDGKYFGRIFIANCEAYLGPFKHRNQARRAALQYHK